MNNVFAWLDENRNTARGKLINQAIPIVVCFVLFAVFMIVSDWIITVLINPTLSEKISLELRWFDVAVGFFLYFVTAIDYALIVGRMQVTNPGSKPRLVMNIFTCVGCFVGVTLVLFLWGFAKEVALLIIPVLIFAGSVMIKLAYESIEYFENNESLPKMVRVVTVKILEILYVPSRVFTFWMPEIARPSTGKMSLLTLAKWSLFLPFIIGLDDLIGYMGAMTIFNVYSLLFGIYLADIVIDILIFVSPTITKKIVQSPVLSLIAVYAFLFLAYKSYSESFVLMIEHFHLSIGKFLVGMAIFLVMVVVGDLIMSKFSKKKFVPEHEQHGRE